MFGLFKKKTEVEKLQEKYEKLMKEWHSLSTVNRSESDKKYEEADAIAKQIERLKNEAT
ncbi:Lacal_2735 family protein [Gelatiniphilus marinus]|uniref:Lacal_2735 family protein n=1 Tax=Gelatiniphilus marinus TaxID=1759464 RepID=A0ABW5JQ10_9FLAO